MKSIIVYFKAQKIAIVLLILFILIPYALISMYIPQIPYMHYFFIISLFVIRMLVFEEGQYKKKIRPMIQSQLTKELKRNPSGDEIFKRIQFYIRSRDFSLLLTGIVILAMSIYFQQF